MQWGPQAKFLTDLAKETGIIPSALANRPVVKPECQQYFEAFFRLSASRSSNGYSWSAITVGEVKDFAILAGLDRDEGMKLLRIVQAMDSEYLAYHAKLSQNKTS